MKYTSYSAEAFRNEFMSGVEQINDDKYHEAIISFQNALSILSFTERKDPELESSCYYNLGQSYTHLGDLSSAITAFKKAIEIKPTNEDAYLGLSDCYFKKETIDDLKKAESTLTQCLRLFPNNQIANLNKGVALFKLDQYHEAYNTLQKAVTLGSKEASLYILIVQKYL